jgi:hypothetical protein
MYVSEPIASELRCSHPSKQRFLDSARHEREHVDGSVRKNIANRQPYAVVTLKMSQFVRDYTLNLIFREQLQQARVEHHERFLARNGQGVRIWKRILQPANFLTCSYTTA